jgi:UDP:flavonoid glycosyltransferase YjiC (YdhE family)
LNMCCAGVLAGIPQVIVFPDQEKRLHAQALTERGAGFMLAWSDFTAGELAAAIREAHNNGAVLRAAQTLAEEMAPFARLRPAEEVAKTVLDVLG